MDQDPNSLNQQTGATAPILAQTTPTPPAAPVPTKSGVGALIGIIVIIAVLALGGIYYYVMQMQVTKPADENLTSTTTNTVQTTNSTQSDDPNAIEKDLNSTSVDVNTDMSGSVNSNFGSSTR